MDKGLRVFCSLALVAFVAVVTVAAPPRHEARAAGPRGAVAHTGLVLKKLDLSSPPSYPTDPALYLNLPQLVEDVQAVQNVLTDPVATGGWCTPIDDILSLASVTYYFADTGGTNQARDEFIQDWNRVKKLAGCAQ